MGHYGTVGANKQLIVYYGQSYTIDAKEERNDVPHDGHFRRIR